MTSVYADPQKTAAFMAHLAANEAKITELKKIMKGPNVPMHERVLAFSELYMIMKGDPHAQRRLVVELEIEARKEKDK